MNAFPFLPPIVTLPAAVACMVLVVHHARLTLRSNEPPSRKRIRVANACLMTLTLPLLVLGFSLVDPRRFPREWTLVWIAAISLLSMNVGLAVLDTVNTLRLLAAERRRLRGKLLRPPGH